MVEDELIESLSRVQREIARAIDDLAEANLSNAVQVRLVQELLQGRRTTTELVKMLYGLGRGDPGFSTHYYRIGLELRELESRGIVWRRPFGKDRPYALTQVGLARLTAIKGARRKLETKAVTKLDFAAYLAMVLMGAIGSWMRNSSIGEDYLPVIVTLFFVATGFALSRFVESIRRVV